MLDTRAPEQAVVVPLWALAAAAAGISGSTWLGRRRRLRLTRGCRSCGYDTRGLAGGVCPECGSGRDPA